MFFFRVEEFIIVRACASYPTNQSHAGDYIAGLVVAAVGRALSGVPPLAVRRSEWREREMVIS